MASVTGEAILDRHGVDRDAAVDLLKDFVATPSGTGHEEAMARLFVRRGSEGGLSARLQEIAPGRFNALAVARGSSPGPALLFNGHMDTSYTGAEPHLVGLGYRPEPTIRGDWLLGLGAYNMKSGLAAALVAATALARGGALARGSITVAGVSGEIEKSSVDEFQGPEYMGYGFGTRQLVAHGATADFAVVCEPTDFEVAHGHLGALWLKVSLSGESTHTVFSSPATDHAIYKGARLVAALEEWGREYASRNAYDGQPATFSVGAVRGGWPWRISRTPARCELYLDVRTTPAQRMSDVVAEVESVVAGVVDGSPFEVHPYVLVPAVTQDTDGPLFAAFREAHEALLGQPARSLFRGPMADTGHLVHAGIPTVTYGLGPMASFDQVHPETGEAGEHVSIGDYLKLIAVYLDVMNRMCGEGSD